MPSLSNEFQQLYCDAAIYENFSAQHPISFKRVLPFQPQDSVVDDQRLLDAESAHLASQNNDTRVAVVDAYALCGLMSAEDTANLKSAIDYFEGSDFFDVMGLVYGNAGMFICALRWYRERIVEFETKDPEWRSDDMGVHASVGYSLYALGMFEESIAWTKSCAGPRLVADTVCRALIEFEAQPAGGMQLITERAAGRVRYTVIVPDPASFVNNLERLKSGLKSVAPYQESYFDVATGRLPAAESQEGYPFSIERDSSNFIRHKMNLLFALCGGRRRAYRARL